MLLIVLYRTAAWLKLFHIKLKNFTVKSQIAQKKTSSKP